MDVNTNRYLIFAGETHYPSGGVNDLFGFADDEEYAIKTAEMALRIKKTKKWKPNEVDFPLEINIEWVQVIDTKTLKVIYHAGEPFNNTQFTTFRWDIGQSSDDIIDLLNDEDE
jgi:hypothetical protein